MVRNTDPRSLSPLKGAVDNSYFDSDICHPLLRVAALTTCSLITATALVRETNDICDV